MGVNRAGFGIIDDAVVQQAANQEVIRRCFRYRCEYALGFSDEETVQRAELIMRELNLTLEDRTVVKPARQAAQAAPQLGKGHDEVFCGAALELPDGTIVTGMNSPLMHAASSLVINAIKRLAEIPDRIPLISDGIIESIGTMKRSVQEQKSVSLDLEETLIALSISATANPAAQLAMEQLPSLRACEVHMTHIPTPGDDAGLRKLGVNLTSDPSFAGKSLFMS